MRDYGHVEEYLKCLACDIYAQPPDPGHTMWATQVLRKWLPLLEGSVFLDVGCGQGFCKPIVEKLGWEWTGVTLGPDFDECVRMGVGPICDEDMTFLSFEDAGFDVILARHVLEHSPMPLLTLMEWRRVSRKYLILVVPREDAVISRGRNHYYLLNEEQWLALLEFSGWDVERTDQSEASEYRWLCTKKESAA